MLDLKTTLKIIIFLNTLKMLSNEWKKCLKRSKNENWAFKTNWKY